MERSLPQKSVMMDRIGQLSTAKLIVQDQKKDMCVPMETLQDRMLSATQSVETDSISQAMSNVMTET